MKTPAKSTLKELTEKFKVELCSHGPTSNGWEGDYLECPLCKSMLEKNGNHGCDCGNIFIDGDMLRIVIEDHNEKSVDTYYVHKK